MENQNNRLLKEISNLDYACKNPGAMKLLYFSSKQLLGIDNLKHLLPSIMAIRRPLPNAGTSGITVHLCSSSEYLLIVSVLTYLVDDQ